MLIIHECNCERLESLLNPDAIAVKILQIWRHACAAGARGAARALGLRCCSSWRDPCTHLHAYATVFSSACSCACPFELQHWMLPVVSWQVADTRGSRTGSLRRACRACSPGRS